MSITTIIGIVGGLAMIGVEYWSTGQITPARLTESFAFAGLGYFAQDGKIFIPIIAKVLNIGLDKATGKKSEIDNGVVKFYEDDNIVAPSKLPNENRTDMLRKQISERTELKKPNE